MPEQDDLTILLRYVGQRFDGARLPLDVLDDLPAFRELLIAFAKEAWRRANPKRERVPKGFERSLSFSLTGVQDGSAKPCLAWDRRVAQQNLPDLVPELEALVTTSYRSVIGLINAANDEGPMALSPGQVRALNRFGSSLQDGERIEFLQRDGATAEAILDPARRKALITRVRETYEARYENEGVLEGVGRQDQVVILTVLTEEYGRLSFPLEVDRTKEFDGSIGEVVQFDLQVALDSADRFHEVVAVHSVAIVDDVRTVLARSRIDELARLPGQWDGGSASPVQAAARESAERMLVKRPLYASSYRVYPTSEGGILFEFITARWDLSVEFLPTGQVEIFGIDANGGGEEVQPLSYEAVSAEFLAQFDQLVAMP